MAEPTNDVPRSQVYRILLSDALASAKGMPCWNEAFRAALAGRGLTLAEPDLAYFHPSGAYPDDKPLAAPTCNIGPGGWPAGTLVVWARTMLQGAGFDIPPEARPVTELHNGEMVLPRAYAEKIRALVSPETQARIKAMRLAVVPTWLEFNWDREELVIHGKRYAASVFGPEGWAAQAGTVLQIVVSEPDVIALRRIDYEPDPQARWHRAMAQEDDCHVADAFLDQVKSALRSGREKGRGGWQTADVADIHAGLHKSLTEGSPVDVAAYCMFLWSRGDRTEPAPQPAWKVGPLTPAAEEILGRICTQCIRIAQLLRLSGHQIATRAEAEQAAVIHYLLGFYATHGDAWAAAADADIKAKAAAALRAKEGSTP